MRGLAFAAWSLCLLGCRSSPHATKSRDPSPEATQAAVPPGSDAKTMSPLFRCALLETDIKSEFDVFLSQHRACSKSSDCALANTDCPLGCYHVAVAKTALREAKIVSDRLLARFESQDCGCAYKCYAPETVACVDHRCVAQLPAGEALP